MNQNYTVTANGLWWDVRRPNGKRVTTFSRTSPGDPWQQAMNTASRLCAQHRLRDQKHAELFPVEPVPLEGFDAFLAHIREVVSSPIPDPEESPHINLNQLPIPF